MPFLSIHPFQNCMKLLFIKVYCRPNEKLPPILNIDCVLCNFTLFVSTESEKINAADSILIIGGGPTGVELAGEIVAYDPNKKVTLVHRGSRLLEFIGAKASKKALDWLTSRKVEVLLSQSVDTNSAADGTYRTSGGETITADCHFVCTGKPIGSSWLKGTIFKDYLDGHGKLVVDDNLRVRGLKKVFAIGDITALPVSICGLSFFLVFDCSDL